MGKHGSLKSAIEQIRIFIKGLSGALTDHERSEMEIIFSHEERGLALSGADATEFRACLDALYGAVPRPEWITRKGTESLLQRTILAAIEFERDQLVAEDNRIATALSNLEAALSATPREFGVYIPVVGFAAADLPFEIGHYQFKLFDTGEYNRFCNAKRNNSGRPHHLIDRAIGGDFLGTPVAYRAVEALEPNAARDFALADLRPTIDVINFYTDLIPYNYAQVSLPGDRDGAAITIPILDVADAPRCTISKQRVGRLGHLSAKKLLDANREFSLQFERVHKLLLGPRNKMEDVLLASIRWAGRATASDRNEDAFLLYIIALESLILADQDPRELSYRLRLRTACLLADDYDDRQKLYKRLGELYNLRSKIVHNGYYEVSDMDLGSLRLTVKSVILKLCESEEFRRIPHANDFARWLEQQILS